MMTRKSLANQSGTVTLGLLILSLTVFVPPGPDTRLAGFVLAFWGLSVVASIVVGIWGSRAWYFLTAFAVCGCFLLLNFSH